MTLTQTRAEPTATADTIAAEHRALNAALEKLLQTGEPAELLPQLEQLRGMLEQHYAGEEADDGLPELIGANAPHLLEPMQRIFAEHREFLTTVDGLSAQARALIDQADELGRGVADFVARTDPHCRCSRRYRLAAEYCIPERRCPVRQPDAC